MKIILIIIVAVLLVGCGADIQESRDEGYFVEIEQVDTPFFDRHGTFIKTMVWVNKNSWTAYELTNYETKFVSFQDAAAEKAAQMQRAKVIKDSLDSIIKRYYK